LSESASQNLTYHCKKSIGYFDAENRSYKKGLKLVGFNDVDITPRGNPKMKYTAIEDECKVSVSYVIKNSYDKLNMFYC